MIKRETFPTAAKQLISLLENCYDTRHKSCNWNCSCGKNLEKCQNYLHHRELGFRQQMQINKTHISNCWQTRTVISCINTSTICLTSLQNHTQTHTHTPGLTEPLLKPWSLLVPPPPEPDLNSPFWPTGLLTQRRRISLRHKGNDPGVRLFPLLHWQKLHTRVYSLMIGKVWCKTKNNFSISRSKHLC